MTEILKLLARQARWQKSRRELSWPEKVRMAEQVRSAAQRLRARSPIGTPEDRR